MPIKTILLPLRDSPLAPQLLDNSLAAAKRFEAHLDVLHVSPPAEEMLPYATLSLTPGMRKQILEAATRSSSEEVERLEARFEQHAAAHGVPVGPRGTTPGRPSAAFNQMSGRRDSVVGRQGRLADLLIVPRPSRTSPPPSTFDAALRGTGRPVIMVPPGWDAPMLGEHALIGWNASKEAAQAIAAARPCLCAAKQVTVMCSEKRMTQSLNGNDVISYLRCHGVEAQLCVFKSRGRGTVGAALLGEAAQRECDLLVVGGYSGSRVREVVSGGVTQYLLRKADRPVLLVH